jgi:hypothetical protein
MLPHAPQLRLSSLVSTQRSPQETEPLVHVGATLQPASAANAIEIIRKLVLIDTGPPERRQVALPDPRAPTFSPPNGLIEYPEAERFATRTRHQDQGRASPRHGSCV